MGWTINHSQVNVTDRRLAFSPANRMYFDNITGIALFSCTHSSASDVCVQIGVFVCCWQDAGVALVIKLSPKFARTSIEVEKGKGGPKRRREERA